MLAYNCFSKKKIVRCLKIKTKSINKLTKSLYRYIKMHNYILILTYLFLLIVAFIELFHLYLALAKYDVSDVKLYKLVFNELKDYQSLFFYYSHCFTSFFIIFLMRFPNKIIKSDLKEDNGLLDLLRLLLDINIYSIKPKVPIYKKAKAYLYFYYAFWKFVLSLYRQKYDKTNNRIISFIRLLNYIIKFFTILHSL